MTNIGSASGSMLLSAAVTVIPQKQGANEVKDLELDKGEYACCKLESIFY